MTELNREPHVSGHELRAALTTSARSRPNPLVSEARPAWEWTTDEQAALTELREAQAALELEIRDLRGVVDAGRAREAELRQALSRVVAARPWHRRGVVAELTRRGLV